MQWLTLIKQQQGYAYAVTLASVINTFESYFMTGGA